MIIIGFCDGQERKNDGTIVKGIKVYYREKISPNGDKNFYGCYAAVAFFPDSRYDGRKQIDNSYLEDLVDEEKEVDIYFNNFGRDPVIIPRQ